ncbi:hypothetical protein [Dissulfurispira sp.]|uniref:hypothetical protein n=1 Tax=Dissulfurispira sp. TaxID=2817609 RepID=UPI002FDA0EA4
MSIKGSKYFIIILLIITFAVNISAETSPPANDYIGKNPLYAQLEKVDGKYIITKISNTEHLIFKLNDLSHKFDTKKYECVFSYGKLVSGPADKCKDNENVFRKVKANVAKTGAITILTLGMSAISGGTYHDSIFDSEAYNKAVEEGLNRSNINRQQLLAEYDNFMDSINALRSQYSSEYESYLKNNIKIVHQIQDESGFYKNDVNLLSLYSVNKNHIPQAIEIAFNPSVESYKTVFNELLKSYEDRLKSITSNYQMHFRNSQKIGDYTVEIVATSNIPYKKDETQNIPVIFTIRSKDFKNIYPKYINEDNALRIEFDGKKINFVNKTDNFIQVKSISVYYNAEISNFNLGDKAIELPPQASTKDPLLIDIYTTAEIKKMANYANAIKGIAVTQNLSFGFAIKYRLIEQNIDKTLYKQNKYNLYDVLTGTYRVDENQQKVIGEQETQKSSSKESRNVNIQHKKYK